MPQSLRLLRNDQWGVSSKYRPRNGSRARNDGCFCACAGCHGLGQLISCHREERSDLQFLKTSRTQMEAHNCASPSIKHQASSINPRAFTLLELILVMVILSTVLALSGPSLRGFFASRRTRDAAAQILALTQWARSQAVTNGSPVRLVFDDRENSYWLTVQKGGTYERMQTEFGRTFFLPQGTEMEFEDLEEDGNEDYIQFDPRSTVTAGTIRLIDRRGYVVKLVCQTPTESYTIEVLNEYESRRET